MSQNKTFANCIEHLLISDKLNNPPNNMPCAFMKIKSNTLDKYTQGIIQDASSGRAGTVKVLISFWATGKFVFHVTVLYHTEKSFGFSGGK